MQKIFNIIAICLSLTTAVGVFIHDGRIDKAALSVRPVLRSSLAGDSQTHTDLHTHAERTSRGMNSFTYQSPSIQPRENRSRRHLMQAIEPRGRHAFDNCYLPVVS